MSAFFSGEETFIEHTLLVNGIDKNIFNFTKTPLKINVPSSLLGI